MLLLKRPLRKTDFQMIMHKTLFKELRVITTTDVFLYDEQSRWGFPLYTNGGGKS